ncbi:MAG: 3-hydroxyacyl-CoA dehydrogenase NAD-binding domain-containing protein [Chromatiales bacterium]
MNEVAQYSVRDGIAVIALNNPPVNSLGHALRAGIVQGLDKAARDPLVKALVLIGAAKVFSGGADLRELNTPKSSARPMLSEINDAQDRFSKPMVGAIGGFALGGGLELALGCHYRVAAPNAQFALPEVKLGILPGSGGTQRLPRAIPTAEALDMMVSGRRIGGAKARVLGLVDELTDGDLFEGALAYAKKLVAEGKGPRRLRDQSAKFDGDAAGFFAAARERVSKELGGYPAPLEIVACVEAAVTKPFDEGISSEHERFEFLVNTPESQALRHVFFAEREAAKIPDVSEATAVREIKRAAIVGAGTMGGGIAMALVNAGIPVTLIETSQEALDRGLRAIEKNYAASVSKGRLTQWQMDTCMGLIKPSIALDDAAEVDIVIEAVFERMDIKQEIFRKLDAIARRGAILATNTSTLDVDAIARVTKRPQDVIGTHFFSPANVMRLLEVVRCAKTAQDVLATVMKLGKTIGKVPIVSGVCDGFIGNRTLEKYLQQAMFLLDDGATPAQVDNALEGWGLKMGPFAMYDMAGNDIFWEIRKRQYRERPDMVYSLLGDRICEQGWFGQKTGRGWYCYEAGNRRPIPDPAVGALIAEYRKEIGAAPRAVSDQEIVERCVYALVNEAAFILEEGIALRASDIDVVYLTGYGFPPWRGGPMFYASRVGLPQVVDAIERFQKGYEGNQWKLAPLLGRLAVQGETFSDYDLKK